LSSPSTLSFPHFSPSLFFRFHSPLPSPPFPRALAFIKNTAGRFGGALQWLSYIGAFGATAPPDSQSPVVQFVQIRVFWGRGRGGGLRYGEVARCVLAQRLTSTSFPMLMHIQQNKFYWISNRSGVAEIICTVTIVLSMHKSQRSFAESRQLMGKGEIRLPFFYNGALPLHPSGGIRPRSTDTRSLPFSPENFASYATGKL